MMRKILYGKYGYLSIRSTKTLAGIVVSVKIFGLKSLR